MIEDDTPAYFRVIKSAQICGRCLTDVEQLQSAPLYTYLTICDYLHFYKRNLTTFSRLDGCGCYEVQDLEKNGYIVTTETNQCMIDIVPVGYMTPEGDFIACKRDHL